MGQKFFIGLDCGTNSVGWAVTDEEYALVKRGGKTLWGVRLFDEASTAQKRRMARSARRRAGRKSQRLALLREIFATEIAKKDIGFYTRLNESKFWQEDKHIKTKYALFDSVSFTDLDYYRQYPTIFHLRSALARGDTPDDVRLLFLGINHILKHRGHFLHAGLNISDKGVPNFNELWVSAKSALADFFNVEVTCSDVKKLDEILSYKAGIRDKKDALQLIFSIEGSNEKMMLDVLVGLLAGSKVDISKLFVADEDTQESIPKICFSDDMFENDENIELLQRACGDGYAVFLHLKSLYDYGILANILRGHEFYSESKVASYEKHQKDLRELKDIIKQYAPEEYPKLFRAAHDKLANYSAYVGYCNTSGKKSKRVKLSKPLKPEDFFIKTLKPILKSIFEKTNCEIAKKIINEIDRGTFLPKQTTKENSVVPNQVHQHELKAILANNTAKFPFLAEKDEQGFSNADKIKSLLAFRIPYYVGPLNDAHRDKGFCWVIKREGKIRPWNFDSMVDKEACAEKFIENLTSTCTYLIGQTVLPKSSIKYSRYMVLNELNNLRIYGEPLSVELKQQMFDTLFLRQKKVTGKILHQWLVQNGIIKKDEKDVISGIDGDFTSSRSIEIDLRSILGNAMPSIKVLERCIQSILCLSNEPAILKKRLAVLLCDATDKQINSLAKLRLTGWGRFSAEFLDGRDIAVSVTNTGEAMTILEALYNTKYNLMQLLSGTFGFSAAIEAYNSAIEKEDTISYETVADLYTSPAVKRSIWQAYSIVKEIEHIMGGAPEKIFIEMARGSLKNEKGKRKISRKALLISLYESIKKEKDTWWASVFADKNRNWKNELEERDEARYRSDKLYLYYTQMGRCMYTGQAISLNDLNNENEYNIDHIWPQARLKDDSLENRVLVTRQVNADKGDTYPIAPEIRKKQFAFWKALYDKKFIGKKKWERLTRNTKFADDELAGFINRQLVETRQSTKELAKILQMDFKKTEIVYVKSGNVSDFRQLYDIVKLRELNDLHHAKDAYLNIVVGNVYHVRFTNNPLNFIKEEQQKAKYEYSMKPQVIFERDVRRGNVFAWKAGKEGSIAAVLQQVNKNNVLVTYQCVERGSGQNGGFHDQNPLKGKAGLIPLKTADQRFLNTERYGGYSGDTGAYAFLVEHSKGRKRVRSIEFMMLSKKDDYENLLNGLEQYCEKELGLKEPRILLKKILFNSVIKMDGFPICLTGRSGEQILGKITPQLVLSPDMVRRLKAACKIAERAKEQKNDEMSVTKEHDNFSADDAMILYDALLEKAEVKIFANRPSAPVAALKKGKEIFETLPLPKQCIALSEILKLFTGNGEANLALIDGKENVGKVRKSATMSESKQYALVTTSPTGFYTSVIDLQKI